MRKTTHSPVWRLLPLVFLASGGFLDAQFLYFEDFQDDTAPGWTFVDGGNGPGPRLTANATPDAIDPESGDAQIDTVGNGWLRLASTTGNQDNAVYLDARIPSSANEITISFDFTMWSNDFGQPAEEGADGIAVFVFDADVPFDEGANGGSLSYAQKSGGQSGLDGGFFGVGLDSWGNFSNATEGRTGSDPALTQGGGSTNEGFEPNQVVVRGADDSVAQDGSGNYYYVAGTGGSNYADPTDANDPAIQDLADFFGANDQLNFDQQDFRPDQDAEEFRKFSLTLNESNQLTVSVEFGEGTGLVDLFTTDLSSYTRPDNLSIGFGSATGGAMQVHEIRNLLVTATGIDDTWYWTDANTDDGGESDRLWTSTDNWTPQSEPGVSTNEHADVVFGDGFTTSPTSAATVAVDGGDKTLRDLFFTGEIGFTLEADSGEILIFDSDGAGESEVNVLNNPGGNADHVVDLDISLNNGLRAGNYVDQEFTFAGDIDTNGNDVEFDTVGTTTVSGVISEGADVTVEGTGTTRFSGTNTYTGTTTVGNGSGEAATLAISNAAALGGTGSGTTVLDGATLALEGGVTFNSESVTINGDGVDSGGALRNASGTNTWTGGVTLGSDSAIGVADGTTLNISGTLATSTADHDLTLDVGDAGTLNISGNITDPWSAGSQLIKEGLGTAVISANTGYTGATTINEGTLQANVNSALGVNWQPVTVNDGGTLALGGSGFTYSTKVLTIDGDGADGKAALWNEANNHTWSGAITLAGDSSIGSNSGILTLNQGIGTGNGNDLTINGSGTVRLNNNANSVGDITIESGTLDTSGWDQLPDTSLITIEAGGTLDLASGGETIGNFAGAGSLIVSNTDSQALTYGGANGDTTFSGTLSGSADIFKNGTGTTTFTGANSYDGEFQVNAGAIRLGADNTFDDDMDIWIAGGDVEIASGVSDTVDEFRVNSSGALDFLGNSGSLDVDDVTYNGGTLNYQGFAGTITTVGGSISFGFDNDTDFVISNASVNTEMSQLATNTFFPEWGSSGEWIQSGSEHALVPALDDFDIWNGSHAQDDRWNQKNNWQDVDGNTSGSDPDGNGRKALISDLDPDLDGKTINLRTDITVGVLVIANDDDFTISSNNNGHQLEFNNSGNTAYFSVQGSGSPTIDREILLEDDLVITNNSTGTLTLTDATNGGFDIITDSSGTNELTFRGTGETLVESQVTGAGAVVKSGTGSVEFTDTNTFSGGFTMEEGTALIGNNQAFGTGTIDLNGGTIAATGANRDVSETYNINDDFAVGNDDGSDLEFSGAGTVTAGDHAITVASGIDFTVGGDLGGSGGLTKSGDGTLVMDDGNIDFSGGLTIDGGTVSATPGALTIGATQGGENYLGTSDITVATGGTLDVDASGDVSHESGATLFNTGGSATIATDDDFSLAGSVELSGGTTTLDAADDFVMEAGGGITMTGGTLNLNAGDGFTTEDSGTGNTVTIDVSGGGVLNADLTPGTGNGSVDAFIIDEDDVLTVDGAGSAVNITGKSGMNIDLEGEITVSDGGVIEVFAGETNLDSTTTLDGGTAATKGTLIVHGDLNLDTPGLANSPNITIDADSGDTEIAAQTGTQSIENIGTLTKTGAGTTTIDSSINNIQANAILINGGTLLNGSDDQIENDTPMTLAGATWNTSDHDEVLGSLTLDDNGTSATSFLDLGSDAGDGSVIQFANSSGNSWDSGGLLTIDDWNGSTSGGGTDQVIFGTSTSGLSSTQLGQITFRNPAGFAPGYYDARILPSGEIVPKPVPEPSTYFMGALLLGFVGWHGWKRRTAARQDRTGESSP